MNTIAPEPAHDEDHLVAVVGMSCRYPGATGVEEFWRQLLEGRTGLTHLDDQTLREAGVPEHILAHPDHVPVAGLLDAPDQADPEALGLSENEAALMDPQQRVFLECSIEALEAAGLARPGHRGSVGVYAGQSPSSHLVDNLGDRFHPNGGKDPIDSLHLHGLNVADYLPARVAWQLGLDGPTVAVGATCATSLVAVHLAVQALCAQECDTALAGGVTLRLPQQTGYLSVPDGPFSRDGHNRAYGDGATGTVVTQGAGVLVLRRLSDARRDGDPVHAVILGSAIGNDGPARAGFTAPSSTGQARVVAEALAVADVTPTEVGMIEGHGTGTALGDPVEVAALREVFGPADRPWCALGSVKSQIGHTNAAAGVAGMIKAVLSVEHGTIPPTLDAVPANLGLGLDGSAFWLPSRTTAWTTVRRIAGVSSFGIGGIDAHVVVASPPTLGTGSLTTHDPARTENTHDGSTTSASTPPDTTQTNRASARHTHPAEPPLLVSAADQTALEQRIADMAEASSRIALTDLASTLAHGSRHLPWRTGIIASQPLPTVHAGTRAPRLVAVLPGGGAQFAGMAAGLHAAAPAFAASLEHTARRLRELGGPDVLPLALHPEVDNDADPELALPALAAVELAWTDLLASRGLQPDAFLGHSLGECVAAVCAGALDRDDALRLIILRSRLMSRQAVGEMVLVAAPVADVEALLERHRELELAVVNAPALCVVAGPQHAVPTLTDELDRAGIDHRRLRVAAAAHTRLVEPFLPEVRELTSGFARRVPHHGLVSCLTGGWVDGPLEPDHWVRHLRRTTRFDAAVAAAAAGDRPTLFLQAGPGGNLVAPALPAPGTGPASAVLLGWPEHAEAGDLTAARRAVESTLAAAWSHGVELELDLAIPRGRTVALPAYPWQRRPLGPAYRIPVDGTIGEAPSSTSPSSRQPLQLPIWRREPPSRTLPAETAPTVRLAGNSGPQRDQLATALRDAGLAVQDDGEVLVHLSTAGDTDDLAAEALTFREHARTLAPDTAGAGVSALVHVTVGAEDVLGDERVNPLATATTGLARILSQECDDLPWVTVDLDIDRPDWSGIAKLAARLHARGDQEPWQPHRALRHGGCWVRHWQPWHPTEDQQETLPDDAVWLVTGGLGSVGVALAEHVEAAWPRARVVLAGRTLPEPDDPRRECLERLGRTTTARCDVSVPAELDQLLAQVEEWHGRLDVVVHAPVQVDLTPLAELDEQTLRAAFGPKVDGASNLAQSLDRRGDRPRVLLLSSVAGTIGGFGLGAYVTAGRFLDGLAVTRGWTTLDLDRLRLGTAEEASSAAEVSMRHALALRDAVETIVRVVALPVAGLVAASPDELDSRTARLDMRRRDTVSVAHSPGAGSDLDGWQRVVAGIWQRVLSRPVTHVDDDFFALGGHSLLATRVLTLLRDEHGVELRLRDLLSRPTVAGCAELVEAQAGPRAGVPDASTPDTRATGIVPVTAGPGPEPSDQGLPLNRVQHAYWLGRSRGLDPASPDGDGVACHFYLEYEVVDLDEVRYREAWRTVVARHPMLRAVVTDEGEHRIIDLPDGWGPLQVDLRSRTDCTDELGRLREQYSTRVADPARWPLVQPVVVRLDEHHWRVLLSVDVLVCDSASWMLVDREIQAVYEGRGDNLAPVPMTAAACQQALAERATSEAHHRDERYWSSRLGDLPEAPPLAVRRPHQVVGRPHFTRLSARVPAALWQELAAEAGRRHLTSTSLVLAHYRNALARWTGRRDFTITMTVFDRPDLPGADRVVGEFSTILLHESHMPADGDQWAHAGLVQKQLLDDLDHRAMTGLEVLAAWNRRRGRSANVPVVFTSMLGLDAQGSDNAMPAHDHEWLGREVHGLSQTPQVWLDHQAYEHRGDLVLQWDVCDSVVDLAAAREAFDDYVASFLDESVDPTSGAGQQALPAPGGGGASTRLGGAIDHVGAPPPQDRSGQREIVEAVWADLLGCAPAEVGDNSFLALGGDSLLAVRMASQLRQRLGVTLPLNQVRADITVAEILMLLDDTTATGVGLTLVRRQDARQSFPLLPLQQGYFVGQSGGWDISYDTAHVTTDVELTLPDDAPDVAALARLLQDAADAVASHQPMVRARILSDGTQALRAPDDPDGRTPTQVIDLRDRPDSLAGLEDLRRGWAVDGPDPRTGPAVAVDVVLLGGRSARLHVSSSLLVMDGWSASLYDRELFAQLARPGSIEPPLDIDFGDYVATVTSPEALGRQDEDRDWWSGRIDTLPAPPRLPRPCGEARPDAQRMTMREFRLDETDSRLLRERCREHGTTQATALLGIFALALARRGGQRSLLLNSMQHNRVPVHPDVDRLIGAFSRTALLPLTLGDGRLVDLVHAIGDQVDECSRHHLVTAVEVGREVARRRHRSEAIAPVVFQSTLGMDGALGGDVDGRLGAFGTVRLSHFHQEVRTPQVELELRCFELDGQLIGSMASVDALFQDGLPQDLLGEVARGVRELLYPEGWQRWVELAPEGPTGPAEPAALPRTRAGTLGRGSVGHAGAESPVDLDVEHTHLARQVAELWAGMLGLEDAPGPHEDFFGLGGDSLLAVRMLLRLRTEGDVDVSPHDFLEEPTVAGLVARAGVPGGAGPLTEGHQEAVLELRAGTGRPVFLLHPSGGDVLCYVELARLLDTSRPVVAVSDPGLSGHPMPEDVAGMVDLYQRLVTTRQPEGPWTLGGWSMGGTVAHELARTMAARGQQVDALVMVDSNAPERIIRLTGLHEALTEERLRLWQLRSAEAFLGLDLGRHESWRELAEALVQAGAAGSIEVLDARFEVFRRHLNSLGDHQAGVLGPEVPALLLRAARLSYRNGGEGMGVDDTDEADLGWGPWVRGPLHVHDVEAHHYSILRQPAVEQVAARMSAFLAATTSVRPTPHQYH